MPKSLPHPHLPSFFRFIPEITQAHRKFIFYFNIGIICLASAILLNLTINQLILLANNQEQLKKIILERKNIENEVMYWKKLSEDYNNYPDIYLKIASLEFRLGNIQLANSFLYKALSLNPDSEQGRVLGEHISR